LRKTKMLLALAILLPVLIVSASAIIIINTRTMFEAMAAGSIIIHDTFIIDDNKFDVTAVGIIVIGGSPADAGIVDDDKFPVISNGASAGDWIHTFTIMTTDRTPSNTLYQITLKHNQVDPATGEVTSMTIVLYMATDVLTPGVAEGIIVIDGLGPMLATPASYVITVEVAR